MSVLSLPLTVLAIALAAAWISGAIILPTWTVAVRALPRLSRFSLVIAAIPLGLGLVLAIAAFIPGDPHIGQLVGCHCETSMPGWVHLCPLHPSNAAGLMLPALAVIGLLGLGRVRALLALAREPLGLGGGTAPTLIDLPEPIAMLHGWLRPSLVVDRRLWSALDADHRSAILAHERGHLSRRDPMMLFVLRLVVAFAPTPAAGAMTRAWLAAAELDADAIAAREVGPTVLASALLRCARLTAPPLALSWAGGHLERRVDALLGEARAPSPLPNVGIVDAALLAILLVAALPVTPWLHHQVEHVLNLSL